MVGGSSWGELFVGVFYTIGVVCFYLVAGKGVNR